MAGSYNAGVVTAYGAARQGGYTGTYEEFCAQQANFAVNAQTAQAAAREAAASQRAAAASQAAATASKNAAAESETQASYWAGQARQRAEESGFTWFDILDEDGCMYVTTSTSLEDIVSFRIDEDSGNLMVLIES